MTTVAPKRIYLAQRNPTLAREAFKPRWRQHGRLAMSFMAAQNWKNVVRYAHCDTIPLDRPLPGVADAYDGVGIIWFKDQEARERHRSMREARAALHADEEECFARPVDQTGLFCEESVLQEGPRSGVKRMRFLWRRNGVAGDDFHRCWREAYATELLAAHAQDGSLQRQEHNVPLPDQPNGLGCDGVEESWFASMEGFTHAQSRQAALDAASGLSALMRDPITVITEEVVLYPQLEERPSPGHQR